MAIETIRRGRIAWGLPFVLGGLLWLGAVDESSAADRGDAYFTQQQSDRGQHVFATRCIQCHALHSKSAVAPIALSGDAFLHRWRSVNDLYSKISLSMPADKVLSLSETEYLDVVAYLLHENGLPAGEKPLTADRSAMHAMLLRPSPPRSAQVDAGKPGDGNYSLDQAARGKAYFESSCSLCHVAEAKVPKPGDSTDPTFATVSVLDSGGIVMGPIHAKLHLSGAQVMRSYPSVGSFYKRIKFSMPMHEPAGLDDETYRDIVAYLLQVNGQPAGKTDLPADAARLDAMPILETGFEQIFNGRDFSNFGFMIGNGCAAPPAGCASDQPGKTFSVDAGIVSTTGFPSGYMYTTRKFLNFTLRFEYRFTPYPGADVDDVYWGNSGYMLFITKQQVWPKSLEIEGLDYIQMRPLGLGTNLEYTYDEEAMKHARHPTGHWNAVEIESKNGQVRATLNGVLVSVVTRHEFTEAGSIGFQAENAHIAWRNIRIKAEP